MLSYERNPVGRRCEALARRVISGTPPALVVVAVLGSAWGLHAWTGRQDGLRPSGRLPRAARLAVAGGAASEPAAPASPAALADLHVVAPPAAGRVTWIVEPSGSRVGTGDVVARLQSASGGLELRSPAAGAVRAVLRKTGDAVVAGDPLLIVGPTPAVGVP